MSAVPLLKPVSAQSRIAPQVFNLKVSESKKRVRMQDREDVAMEEENGSNTSQECEEDPSTENQEVPVLEQTADRRLIKGKRLK